MAINFLCTDKFINEISILNKNIYETKKSN